jgi:hypothetical protein
MLLNNRNMCFDFFYYSFYYLVTPIELHNIKNVLIKYRVYYPMWDLIFYFEFTHNVLYVPTIPHLNLKENSEVTSNVSIKLCISKGDACLEPLHSK